MLPMQIRTKFAAPFVMVIAGACGGNSRPPPHKNPPPPITTDPSMCTSHKEGDPCTAAQKSCTLPDDGTSACGPVHMACQDGKWQRVVATCNPPPPEQAPSQ